MIPTTKETKLHINRAWNDDQGKIHLDYEIQIEENSGKITRIVFPDVVLPILDSTVHTESIGMHTSAYLELPSTWLTLNPVESIWSKRENRYYKSPVGYLYFEEILKEENPIEMTLEEIESKLGHKIKIVDNK